MNVNTGRVVLGGLLAGLVLNIGEFVLNDIIVGSEMKTWLAAHNFSEPSGRFVATAVGLTFIMGIVVVFHLRAHPVSSGPRREHCDHRWVDFVVCGLLLRRDHKRCVIWFHR